MMELGPGAFMPPGQTVVRRCDPDEPNHRHRRLLRARRERPRGGRAAEQRDKIAPFQSIKLHAVPRQPGVGMQDIELARISQEVTVTIYDGPTVFARAGRSLELLREPNHHQRKSDQKGKETRARAVVLPESHFCPAVRSLGGDAEPSRSELGHCAVPRASCSVAPRIREVNEVLAFTNQKNPGNRGKGNGVNVSNGSSQSARKNTASVSAEQTANSTTSSLSRARDMTCNANAAERLAQLTRGAECRSAVAN
jgi:hypothetical protein